MKSIFPFDFTFTTHIAVNNSRRICQPHTHTIRFDWYFASVLDSRFVRILFSFPFSLWWLFRPDIYSRVREYKRRETESHELNWSFVCLCVRLFHAFYDMELWLFDLFWKASVWLWNIRWKHPEYLIRNKLFNDNHSWNKNVYYVLIIKSWKVTNGLVFFLWNLFFNVIVILLIPKRLSTFFFSVEQSFIISE